MQMVKGALAEGHIGHQDVIRVHHAINAGPKAEKALNEWGCLVSQGECIWVPNKVPAPVEKTTEFKNLKTSLKKMADVGALTTTRKTESGYRTDSEHFHTIYRINPIWAKGIQRYVERAGTKLA